MSNYQVDIKSLAIGGSTDKGYESGICLSCYFQIRKRGKRDRIMNQLEDLARNCFIGDMAKAHTLILRYEKKKA